MKHIIHLEYDPETSATKLEVTNDVVIALGMLKLCELWVNVKRVAPSIQDRIVLPAPHMTGKA